MCRTAIALVCGLLGAVVGSAELVKAQPPVAFYFWPTGEVFFSEVEDIIRLRINSPSGILVPGLATNLGGAADGDFGVVNDQAPDFVEWGNLTGMTFENESAGAILPLARDFVAASAIFNSVEFLYGTTSPLEGPFIRKEVFVVPEPTGIAVFGLAMLALLRTRRLHSQ